MNGLGFSRSLALYLRTLYLSILGFRRKSIFAYKYFIAKSQFVSEKKALLRSVANLPGRPGQLVQDRPRAGLRVAGEGRARHRGERHAVVLRAHRRPGDKSAHRANRSVVELAASAERGVSAEAAR